jgi:hypothetical protein
MDVVWRSLHRIDFSHGEPREDSAEESRMLQSVGEFKLPQFRFGLEADPWTKLHVEVVG